MLRHTRTKPITESSRAFPVVHRCHPGVHRQPHQPQSAHPHDQQIDRYVFVSNQCYAKLDRSLALHAGPPLPETLRLLAPLAPTLEKLNLGRNPLGGTVTEDITAFTNLTELELWRMGLSGACSCMFTSTQKGHHGMFPHVPVVHRCHPGVHRQSLKPAESVLARE